MNLLALLAGGMPGPFELLVILFVILLLFGARKLPELSRSLGRSLSEFKKGREEGARLASGDDDETSTKSGEEHAPDDQSPSTPQP